MESVDEQEESLITDDDLDDINQYPYESTNVFDFCLCCFFQQDYKIKQNNQQEINQHFIPLHPLDKLKNSSTFEEK